MSRISTQKVESYLAENIGSKVGSNIYEFANTVHWIYVSGGKVIAFENTIENEIHIFHATAFLTDFMRNNWWTFDKIFDYESAGIVLNTPPTEEGKLYDTIVRPHSLHQKDIDMLYYLILTSYRLHEAGEDEQ